MRKTALVTGATSGIGREIAIELAVAGYDLVLPCRDIDKAQRLRGDIRLHCGNASLDFMPCDLADLASVAHCAEAITERYPVIDVFLANAATLESRLSFSAQEIERTFAVNHLAHFVLLSWVVPTLYVHSRVIFVASSSARRGAPDFVDDINYRRRSYHYFQAYSNSKLANIACARSFARLLIPRRIACTSVHPGLVATSIWPQDTWLHKLVIPPLKALYFVSPKKGAGPILELACSLDRSEAVGHFDRYTPVKTPVCLSREFEDRLWQRSLQLANEFLPPAEEGRQ